MIGVQAPPVERFIGDRVSFHAVLTEIPVASRGGGDVGKGLKRARGSNTDLKERHPCLSSLTSGLQYSVNSFWKS